MIYGIYSNKDNIIRYVGYTNGPLNYRLSGHKSSQCSPGMRCFVDMAGDSLEIKELTGFSSEQEAIDFYKESGYLLNVTKGKTSNIIIPVSSYDAAVFLTYPEKSIKDIGIILGCSEPMVYSKFNQIKHLWPNISFERRMIGGRRPIDPEEKKKRESARNKKNYQKRKANNQKQL